MLCFSFSTKRKIQIARAIHCIVRLTRRLFDKPMQGHFKRGGLQWDLNLNEGIDFSIWLLGAFEHDMLRVYSRLLKSGTCVLDIGANIGAHTLPLARLVGPNGCVVAIEGTAYAFEKLKANLNLNPDYAPQVIEKHALLVAESGQSVTGSLHSSWPLTENSKAHPVLGGMLKPLGEAQILTVDQLVKELDLPPIDWIKLDVDGNELSVLRGARQTIARDRPHILLELAPYCHNPGQFAELIQWLITERYVLLRADNLKVLPHDAKEIIRHIPLNGSINAYAQPRSVKVNENHGNKLKL